MSQHPDHPNHQVSLLFTLCASSETRASEYSQNKHGVYKACGKGHGGVEKRGRSAGIEPATGDPQSPMLPLHYDRHDYACTLFRPLNSFSSKA